MIIWLSGPTGGGKTSISQALRASGFSIVEETVPPDLFRSFAADPISNCEALQRDIMSARLNGWRAVSRNPRIVFDRSVDEDIEVFCRMHQGAGLLTDTQVEALGQFASEIQRELPNPDLILFISAETDVLLDRLKKAGAPPLIVANLHHQLSLYSRWLRDRPEEIVKLDTTRLAARAMAQLFSEIHSC